MKNLFSLTTNSFFQKIHMIPLEDKNGRDKKVKEIWNEYADTSILRIRKAEKSALENERSIAKIADMCIDICKPLFLRSCNDFNSKKINIYDPLEQIAKTIGYNGKNTPPNLDDLFFRNVKEFLILSFIYNQSCNCDFLKPTLSDISTIFPNLSRIEYDKNSGEKSIINLLPGKLGNIQKQSNQFRRFNRDRSKEYNYSSKRYLDFLIDYEQIPDTIDNKNNESRKKRISHKLLSWYDVPVFAGLVSSSSPSKNPYLNRPGRTCKIDAFLNGFNSINMCSLISTPYNFPYYIANVLKKLHKKQLNEKAIEILDANLFFWYAVGYYLIERVTNVNFVHDILTRLSHHPSHLESEFIYQLSAYPLLSYRLSILNRLPTWSNEIPRKDMDSQLIELLKQHLFVAIPQVDVLFNLALLISGCYFEPIDYVECSQFLNECSKAFLGYLHVDSSFKLEREHNSLDNFSLFSIVPNTGEHLKQNRVENFSIEKIVDDVYYHFGNYAIWSETMSPSDWIQNDNTLMKIRQKAGIYLSQQIDSMIQNEEEKMYVKKHGESPPFYIFNIS